MPKLPIGSLLSESTLIGIYAAVLGGSLMTFVPSALAIDTVELRYQDRSATIPLTDIRQFADTGVASPALESIILRDGTVAHLVGRVLTEEITFTGQLRERLRTRLEDSSLGQFVVYELGKFIRGGSDVGPLRTAIRASLDDNQISILEVLENYPSSSSVVTLDLTQVGGVYGDVKQFVERVIPAVEAAREFLQETICNCESAPSPPVDASPQSQAPTLEPSAFLTSGDCTAPSTAAELDPVAQLRNLP